MKFLKRLLSKKAVIAMITAITAALGIALSPEAQDAIVHLVTVLLG